MSNKIQDRIKKAANNAAKLAKNVERGRCVAVYRGEVKHALDDSVNAQVFQKAIEQKLPAGFKVKIDCPQKTPSGKVATNIYITAPR